MTLLIPSYKTGFARCQAESENPNLRRGLVGLWAPSLGPTGLTLRDLSGYGNHGTLTNMDPATDWVATEKGWALEFDEGSSQRVVTPSVDHNIGTGDFTMVALIKPSSLAGYDGICGNGQYSPGLLSTINGGNFGLIWGANRLSGINLVVDVWQSVVAIQRVGTLRFYLDGVQTPTSHTPGRSMANAVFTIGADSNTGNVDYFDGSIALVLFYSRALAPSEIQQLYVDPHALLRLRRRVLPKRMFVPYPYPRHTLAGGLAT